MRSENPHQRGDLRTKMLCAVVRFYFLCPNNTGWSHGSRLLLTASAFLPRSTALKVQVLVQELFTIVHLAPGHAARLVQNAFDGAVPRKVQGKRA